MSTKSVRFGFGSLEPDGAGGLVETVRSSPWLELRFPLVVVSEPNTRGHWSSRYQRTSGQRNEVVAFELLAAGRLIDQLCGVPLAIEPGRRLTITLTRLGSREIDSHDNLRTAFKATVDEIAKFLGVDDADRRLIWKYAQAPDGRALRDTEVVIRFEVSEGDR